MKKILIIIISLVAITLVGVGVYFGLTSSTNNPLKPTEEIDYEKIGTGGETPDDVEIYNWESKLSEKAVKLLKKVYKNKYDFEPNGIFKISLKHLERKLGEPLKDFNTETISCDLEQSKIIVTKGKNEQHEIEVILVCTKSNS